MTAPEKHATFVLLPEDLFTFVEDGLLSVQAAFLYCVLLKHHNRRRKDDDVWPSRAVLAKAVGLKKVDSVDRYLGELRSVGLIVSEQRRRSGNMKTSSKHTLKLIVPRTAEEIAERIKRSADTPSTGYRYPRQRVTDTPPTGYELEEVELEEVKEVEEISRTAARFAHDGARDSESRDQKDRNDGRDPWDTAEARDQANSGPKSHERATYENWHEPDRETFKQHVGEVLISNGKNWKKGRFTAEAFYKAYRLKEEGNKRWPGQYVETLSYAGEEAVDDWLIDQGLMRPEWQ